MVNHGSTHPTPEPILKLQRQLEDFRSSQPVRTKLPESLWQAAVELAQQYGIYPVAHPLRLGIQTSFWPGTQGSENVPGGPLRPRFHP
jgi:hypothetical protein